MDVLYQMKTRSMLFLHIISYYNWKSTKKIEIFVRNFPHSFSAPTRTRNQSAYINFCLVAVSYAFVTLKMDVSKDMSSFQTLSIEYIEHINLKKILRVIIVSSTSTYKLHLLCYKFCIKVFTQQSFLHHITIAKGCVWITFCDFFLYLNICTSMADLYFSFFCV